MDKYFPELKSLGGRVRGQLDLSNYATKSDLINATSIDSSKLAKKFDLTNLKYNVDKLHIYQLIY